MKTFYGGIFIEKQKLEAEGIFHPIKLEYYKSIREDGIMKGENNRFGISVVKTEYLHGNTKVERKELNNLTNDENKIEEVLRLFKENEVTPISVEDIICDLCRKRRISRIINNHK